MGINTGSPQAVVNRNTWRVDYFGPSVNLAARVESKACGGQTLVTNEVHASLSAAVLGRYVYQSIGPQQYRGVHQPSAPDAACLPNWSAEPVGDP